MSVYVFHLLGMTLFVCYFNLLVAVFITVIFLSHCFIFPFLLSFITSSFGHFLFPPSHFLSCSVFYLPCLSPFPSSPFLSPLLCSLPLPSPPNSLLPLVSYSTLLCVSGHTCWSVGLPQPQSRRILLRGSIHAPAAISTAATRPATAAATRGWGWGAGLSAAEYAVAGCHVAPEQLWRWRQRGRPAEAVVGVQPS